MTSKNAKPRFCGASNVHITSGKRGGVPMVCGGTSSADRHKHVPNSAGILHKVRGANQVHSHRGPAQRQTMFRREIAG